jgi:hypothetical protein
MESLEQLAAAWIEANEERKEIESALGRFCEEARLAELKAHNALLAALAKAKALPTQTSFMH